jgi:drug/metabolite transporter (DMT)-like permease
MACLLCGVINKYVVKEFSYRRLPLIFNLVGSVSAVATLLIWSGFGGASLFSILLAVAFAMCIMTTIIFQLEAIKIGPWSYTTVLISFSTLISAVSGWIFWGEPVVWNQVVGILLIVICIILSVDTQNKDTAKISKRWLAYTLIAFLSNGVLGVLQKTHQKSEYMSEINEFLVIAFIAKFVISLIAFIICVKKDKKQLSKVEESNKDTGSKGIGKIGILFVALLFVRGIFEAVNHKLNLYLVGVIDSAIIFPVLNGSNLILTAILGVLLFKEKQAKKQWIGVVIGVVAVLLLCI